MKKLLFYSVLFAMGMIQLSSCNDDDCCEPACTVGETCDDGNGATVEDKINDDCECIGIAFACAGIGDDDYDGICSNIDCDDQDELNNNFPGSSCDDGNPETDNDMINSACECEGICSNWGVRCDDGNIETYDDRLDISCNCVGFPYETMVDPRDAQEYKTILVIEIDAILGIWMAENLNYDSGNSWCLDDNTAQCLEYGRLYDFETATNVCPTGWHLPTDSEAQLMVDFLGGAEIGGGGMKEAGLNHWSMPNTSATNETGFSGLPGGTRDNMGSFIGEGEQGNWWTATTFDVNNSSSFGLNYDNSMVDYESTSKQFGLSVRCVMD